jgi:hypothetical protein
MSIHSYIIVELFIFEKQMKKQVKISQSIIAVLQLIESDTCSENALKG